METINYLSSKELKNTPYCIKWFFEGENGFLHRNGLYKYFPDSGERYLADVLNVNDKLSRSNESDFSDLCNYIIKEKDERKKSIEKLQKEIKDQQKGIEELFKIGNLIKRNKNLKENLEIILNNK